MVDVNGVEPGLAAVISFVYVSNCPSDRRRGTRDEGNKLVFMAMALVFIWKETTCS